MSWVRSVSKFCIQIAAVAMVSASWAKGLSQPLPPQPLADALETFARSVGLQLVYGPEITQGLRSPGAPAGRSVQDTLKELLRGTGLTFEFVNESTVTIVSPDAGRKAPAAAARESNAQAMHASATWLARADGAQPQGVQARDTAPEQNPEAKSEGQGGELVVTGSRLQRDTYSSISPIQVFDGDVARALGLSDVASIVQQSSVASGFQFDNSITNDSDVRSTGGSAGAATIALRGLNPDRTLVLVNSRRLAPAGVEGVPTQPDLNLIPSALVDRIEVLTDGASSIYGSDAVAGVVNIILKDRFNGLEFSGFSSSPGRGGAEVRNFSLIAGSASENGHLTFGAEYYDRSRLRRSQRDFARCRQALEQSISTGEIHRYCLDFGGTGGGALNLFFDPGEVPDGINPREYIFDFAGAQGFRRRAMGLDLCSATDSILGPGTNTTGVPCVYTPGDGHPDLLAPFGFDERYNTNGYAAFQDLMSPLERYVGYVTGDYDLPSVGTLFFEASYANRKVDMRRGPSPIAGGINVSCRNPYLQANATLDSSVTCAPVPDAPLTDLLGPLGPALNWNPGFLMLGDKQTEVEQVRGVIGLRGDLTLLGDAIAKRWRYEVYGSYTRSAGQSLSQQINEERLALSLNTARLDLTDANGNGRTDDLICGAGGFGSLDRCVPLNLLAPEIYLFNRLPADAAAYILGDATNRTLMTQAVLSGFVSGHLFTLPAGRVPLVMGVEYRDDRIDSRNSYLITSGAGLGGLTQPELDTLGSRSLTEFFVETELPLLADRRFAQFLAFNASARWTDESNFGSLWTYRLQAAWSPVESVTLQATYGTTYRAPNLREQFLADQFSTLTPGNDPCLRQTGAPPITDPVLLANCRAQGADPDLLGAGLTTLPQINVRRGGANDLDAETSRSITIGGSVSQPWFQSFGLKLSANYYDIRVKNSVMEPAAADILAECLRNTPDLQSPFCARIQRATPGTPATNLINTIDASFFNIGFLEARGVDANVSFDKPLTLFGQPVALAVDVAATRQIEASEDMLGRRDENLGEIEYPRLQGSTTVRLTWNNLSAMWRARYSDGGIPDNFGTPAFPTASTGNPLVHGYSDPTTIEKTGTIDPDGDGAPGTLAFLRPDHFPVGRVGDHWYHDLSVSFKHESWSATAGVANLLDKEPPSVNRRGLSAGQFGVVPGAGLDLIGRSYFFNVSKRF